MNLKQPSKARIEINYAALQASHWMSFITFGGFAAVYLSYRGMTDSQIGLAVSLMSLTAIILQLAVADYSDRHPRTPLKYIICILYIVAIAAGGLFGFLPLPIALMTVGYVACMSCENSAGTFLNALMMQYVNRGLPVNYGWPRGIGSICCALFCLALGSIIEKYSPSALIPILMSLSALSMLLVLLMPLPSQGAGDSQKEPTPAHTSYRQMIFKNPTLALFLLACCVSAIGQCTGGVFLIRIIEGLGGGTGELGISLFLQSAVELPILFASAFLLRRFKVQYLLVVSLSGSFVKLLMLTFAPSMGVIYAAMVSSIFGYGLFVFASVVFANSIVGDGERVRAQSVVAFSSSIGSILGNLVSGVIIDTFGLRTLLTIGSAICLAGVLLMLVCCSVCKKQFGSERLAAAK